MWKDVRKNVLRGLQIAKIGKLNYKMRKRETQENVSLLFFIMDNGDEENGMGCLVEPSGTTLSQFFQFSQFFIIYLPIIYSPIILLSITYCLLSYYLLPIYLLSIAIYIIYY